MKQMVIIGDASHNTLSAVRSFGEAGIPQLLILVAEEDPVFVHKSKYLRGDNLRRVKTLDECCAILEECARSAPGSTLMTTFDAAAEWVDKREPQLSGLFRTPCRGRQIGNLFHKDAQCSLAAECGLTVPRTLEYHRGEGIPKNLPYPIITKPLVSSRGEKGDIHICRDSAEFESALAQESHCGDFIIQEFIDKEYEVNCTGVRTENEVVMAAIRKYRHWPPVTGAGAYARIDRVERYGIDVEGVARFLEKAGYYGPFSVEFLHKDGKNCFMEVNFRNDGLAYTATAAGINMHELYFHPDRKADWSGFRPLYMMNYSIDLLYVKERLLSRRQWLRDFIRTRCFININFRDPMPSLAYYGRKFSAVAAGVRHRFSSFSASLGEMLNRLSDSLKDLFKVNRGG